LGYGPFHCCLLVVRLGWSVCVGGALSICDPSFADVADVTTRRSIWRPLLGTDVDDGSSQAISPPIFSLHGGPVVGDPNQALRVVIW
jgi:hypothetical protein